MTGVQTCAFRSEVNGFTVTFEQTGPDRGTIHIWNDTKLHVAPLITSASEVLLDVSEYNEFVSPQGGSLLFLAQEKDYKISTDLRKDISVRLRCIGRKHPRYDPKNPIEVSNLMYAAGLVEGVVLPVAIAAVGVEKKISSIEKLVYSLPLYHASTLIKSHGKGLAEVAQEMWESEIESFPLGPLVSFILDSIQDSILTPFNILALLMLAQL